MKVFKWISSIILLSVMTVGCGKFESANSAGLAGLATPFARKPFGACDRKSVPTINVCMEAVGEIYNDSGYLDILMSSCESSGGAFSTTNCNPQDSFGTCTIGVGQLNMIYVTYYAPTYNAASAEVACRAEGGVFFPW